MPVALMPVEQILTILEKSPPRLAELSRGVPPARLRRPPASGEWSASEILAHIRSCNELWGGYIQRILAQQRPTFKVTNPRTWIEKTDYMQENFEPALRDFTKRRRALLKLLRGLPAHGWSRQAVTTGAGKPLVQTVHSYADRLARHERPHVKQIERALEAG
jgi:hypothetical protein